MHAAGASGMIGGVLDLDAKVAGQHARSIEHPCKLGALIGSLVRIGGLAANAFPRRSTPSGATRRLGLAFQIVTTCSTSRRLGPARNGGVTPRSKKHYRAVRGIRSIDRARVS